jgi:hypothetical protein
MTKASPTVVKPAAGNVKKIVIKSMKELPKLPDNYQVTFLNIFEWNS